MSKNSQPTHHLSYLWKKPINRFFAEVDSASIVLFRICFGFIMLIEVYRYFDHNWITRYWVNTNYHFAYWPFHSLEPLPEQGMTYLFIALGILSVCIILGLFYRLSIVLFFIGFTYMFLLEETRYLNHFYLISLLSLVMICIPAHRSFSIDAKYIFKRIRSHTIPLWCLWLLRLMIGIPFFFGGVAKINADWLAGQPLGTWLLKDTDFPVIGQFFSEHWMILIMSYSGLLLDLFLVPLLLIKRTRIWAFIIGFLFHLMNANLFSIGIFPWFMIVASTLFFAPEWPRVIVNRLVGKIVWKGDKSTAFTSTLSKSQKSWLIVLGIWTFLMLFLPMRHLLIPGNVSWTEEGHKFAWHMKLRTKRAKGYFIVKGKNESFTNNIYVKNKLPSWQRKKTIARPPIIWQFAQDLKEDYAKKGYDVSVYANIEATLNGRPYQQFTNPEVDLTATSYPIWHADWIIPLSTPLPKQN